MGDVLAGVGAVAAWIGAIGIACDWLLPGFIGGLQLSRKKLEGRQLGIWLLVFGLFGVAAWLAFMLVVMVGGPIAQAAAESALPSNKRCPKCLGWNAYEATRCGHCTQLLEES